jgi:signal transduction histidine kinase
MRPPLRHRLTGAQWLRIDVAVAVAAFGAAVFRVDLPRAVAAASAPPWAPALVLVAFGTLPFAARRWLPLPVLAVLAVSAAALAGLGRSPLSLDVTVGIAAYTVAARAPRPVAVSMLVAVEAVLCAGVGVALARDVAGAYAAALPLVAGALWFAGDSVSYRRQYDEAVAAEQERRLLADQERARQAVREERVRIAREIHDVVAHSLTVMTVQAGVARRVVQRPAEARGVLESIETTGRFAQGELRLILGLLRDDEQEEPGLSPAPGLAALPALAEEAKGAGVPVELHVSGSKPVLSPALELSLYQVIQEALTNTVKPAAAGPDGPLRELVAALTTPVRSGIILTRRQLAAGAASAGVGHRIGERRYTLRAMLEQDPSATLTWVSSQARRWERRHASQAAGDAVSRWWTARAARTALFLRTSAADARDRASTPARAGR